MATGGNYLDPKQRAALERRVFEAMRDMHYFEGKARYAAEHGDDGVPEAVVRDAFNRHMEKDWPAEQQDMKKLTDARLEDDLADAVERMDALGLKQWSAGKQPPIVEEARDSPVDHLAAEQFEDVLGRLEANFPRPAAAAGPSFDPEAEWDLVGVRPVTRGLIESIMLDVEPTPAALNDFGIASPAHFEAIAFAVRDDQITFAQLDAAYGNGPMLTELVNAAPSNPHKGITFETPWDWVLGRTGGATGATVQQTVRRMLADVGAVTKSRFYADPDPVASPVEMFRLPDGKPGGEPFSALSVREKIQVLGDYTDWQGYERGGVGSEQLDRVFANVIEGKPREKWLEGTGLPAPQREKQRQPARTRDRQIEPGE